MSNGKNAYLMKERSSNSPRLVENLRFSREAFIKLCLQEHIPMPKQWQALANDMAEKERERRFPNRCSVQEACVLMAGDELDTAEKYDTGDIRFTAEQNALYENLTKKIQKTDFSYSFDGEIWKNPGNVYEPYEAVFSRETYWKWFKENPMGFNDPPWFNGLQIDNEKDGINLSGLSKNEDDLISYLKEWNPLIKKVIPIILIWRSRPDGERKSWEKIDHCQKIKCSQFRHCCCPLMVVPERGRKSQSILKMPIKHLATHRTPKGNERE